MKKTGHSKEDFLEFWGQEGYAEDFAAYQPQHLQQVEALLSSHFNSQHVCMEIGCGSGLWTRKYLAPNFKQVIALDILDEANLQLPSKVRYVELSDRDYECTGVEDESIDFVFSFGVFCHLPNSGLQKYVNAIWRKLKPGGQGLIMFADFHRHHKYSAVHFENESAIVDDKTMQDRFRESEPFGYGGWFWCDMETINSFFENSPFTNFADVSPTEFRDCLMAFSK